MSKPTERQPPAIGWREWVSMPELGVKRIKAKIDTGARSSSVHAFDVKTFFKEDQEFVQFSIHPAQGRDQPEIAAVAPILERRLIRSSNGEAEYRIVIRATLSLLGQQFPIDLTLANRDAMGFRMLIGREALRGRFVVDAQRSFLAGRPAKRSKDRSRLSSRRRQSDPPRNPE
jgi:hypothetical protein